MFDRIRADIKSDSGTRPGRALQRRSVLSLFRLSCHSLPPPEQLSVSAQALFPGPLGIPACAAAYGHRRFTRPLNRPGRVHRPRHGRRHRRNGGGRRQLRHIPGRDSGRDRQGPRQAAPDARQQRHGRRGREDTGPFRVGDNAKIAANAVVLEEIPPDSTAVGVPAKIVRREGQRVEQNLDQVHMPTRSRCSSAEWKCA